MSGVRLLAILGYVFAMCGVQHSVALANDTTAELSLGGLTFTHNPNVSMQSEDLTVTPDIVTVHYRFLNQSPNPVTVTVAFPLPDIDLSQPDVDYAIPVNDSVNFVGFKTKIDGAPVSFNVRQRAFLAGKDVTETIAAAGLPMLPIGAQFDKLNALPAATKAHLAKQGVLAASGVDAKGNQLYDGNWTVKTSIIRLQTFPPGVPVSVEHQYRTSVGMSFDTVLRKAIREQQSMAAEIKRYRADYCISDAFLRGVDRRAGAERANVAHLQERRISYVLSTGANWAGPIKQFRLLVNKGRPDRLISFCGDNVKKISPTEFEMRAENFVPRSDLKILLIGAR